MDKNKLSLSLKDFDLKEGIANRIAFGIRSVYDRAIGRPNVNAAEVRMIRAQLRQDEINWRQLQTYMDQLRDQRDNLASAYSVAYKRDNELLAKQIKNYLNQTEKSLEQYRKRAKVLRKQMDEKTGRMHTLMGDGIV